MNKKVLFFPNCNTLSYISRAFTLSTWLQEIGVEAHIAVSKSRYVWASSYYDKVYTIDEITEPSKIPYPTIKWFSDENLIEKCVESQEQLIQKIKPDFIISLFDFTSAISSKDIPRLSINGECMLPTHEHVLGFTGIKNDISFEQQKIMDGFWEFAARSYNKALRRRGMKEVLKANELLLGDENCLFEIEEIGQIVNKDYNYKFIGPIFWNDWNRNSEVIPWKRDDSFITIYVNLGTLGNNSLIEILIDKLKNNEGLRIICSTGINGVSKLGDRIIFKPFISPNDIYEISDLSICTGGIGSCYSNLWHGIPSLIVPTHPEQVTNGMNFEKAGCARVIEPNEVFIGDSDAYLANLNLDLFHKTLTEMLVDVKNKRNKKIVKMRKILHSYNSKDLFVNSVIRLLQDVN